MWSFTALTRAWFSCWTPSRTHGNKKNNLFFRLWLQWSCLATRGQSPIENRNRFMFRRVEEKNKSCKTTSSTKKLKKTRDRPRVTTERKQSIKHNKQKRDTCKMTQKKTNDQKKVSIKYGNKTKKTKNWNITQTEQTRQKYQQKPEKQTQKKHKWQKKRCRMFRNILKMTAKTQSDAKEKQKAAKNMQSNYKKRTWKKNECSQTTRKQTEKRYNVDTRCKIIEHVITEIK